MSADDQARRRFHKYGFAWKRSRLDAATRVHADEILSALPDNAFDPPSSPMAPWFGRKLCDGKYIVVVRPNADRDLEFSAQPRDAYLSLCDPRRRALVEAAEEVGCVCIIVEIHGLLAIGSVALNLLDMRGYAYAVAVAARDYADTDEEWEPDELYKLNEQFANCFPPPPDPNEEGCAW